MKASPWPISSGWVLYTRATLRSRGVISRSVVGVARSCRHLVPSASIRETELSLMHWDRAGWTAAEGGYQQAILTEDVDGSSPTADSFVSCADTPACPGHGRVRAGGGRRGDAGAAVVHAVQPGRDRGRRPGQGAVAP